MWQCTSDETAGKPVARSGLWQVSLVYNCTATLHDWTEDDREYDSGSWI
jgi:hypothetical protein